MNVLKNIKTMFSTPKKAVEISIPVISEQAADTMAKPSFKGDVIQKPIKFPEELGEEHPFDFSIAEDLYKTNPLINGTVDKYLDYILGPGIWVTSENKKAEDLITIWLQDTNFNYHLRKWIKEALMKGTGFLELARNKDKNIVGVKVRNAKFMYIKEDEKGNIVKYNQYFGKVENYQKSKVTPFELDEMANIAINPIADNVYGEGIVQPLCATLNKLLGNEKALDKLMERKANAPLHWKVGQLNSTNPQLSLIPDSSVLSQVESKLTHMTEKTEWVTGPEHEAKVIDFGNFTDKFDSVLSYYNTQFIYGSQIPEVLFGTGSIPEGLAKEQRKGFDRRITAFQLDIEKTIEEDIFRQVLQSNNIDDHVEVHWGEKDVDETNERINQIRELLKIPFLEPALAYRLQQELVSLFDFGDTVIPDKMPDQEAQDKVNKAEKDAEENEALPIIPGANRINNSRKIAQLEAEQEFGYIEGGSEDIMLKEWLGFNFLNYKAAIHNATERDKFSDLVAKTQEQIEAGLLNKDQIEELRKVMDEGFQQDMSINEISKNIDKRVAPGDRYQLDETGQLKRNVSGQRILSVPAKARGAFIARTEATRLANLGALETYKDAGVTEYKWVAAYSDRTCPICEELNGQIYEMGKSEMRQPPAHVMCRCTVVPVVKLSASIRIRELALTHLNEHFKAFNDPFIKEFHQHEEV